MAPFCFYNPREMYDGEYLKIYTPIRAAELSIGTLYLCQESVAYLSTGIGQRRTFAVDKRSHNRWVADPSSHLFLLTKRGAARMRKDRYFFAPSTIEQEWQKWTKASDEEVRKEFYRRNSTGRLG
jgi:hypothetical protein